ncbi:adenylosuccinate lyase [Marixanthomonas ophiurae]|uniref:Adenylosuccinate lyase n=1 Tax=Marixanthomonas ophiurae TaxID=387659 RepID=A0A3E1Q6X0_9FLAO|nr:adenylosuccinate lyase [Marixanthomonas ophiurae]RFN57885.1 adenylosuccinate lyase [Marixanthomonas ophiurae]
MSDSGLLQQLSYTKAYRKNRLDAAHWVIVHPETFGELLTYCLTAKDELSYKAAWVLEFVYLEKPELLLPHLNLFFEKLPTITRDQTLRPLAHICELITISYYKKKEEKIGSYFSEAYKKIMVECCFDWLITDKKIACQARAMTALFYLGTEFEWIHSELKQIIEQNIHLGSAGYKARGKNTIKQINTFQKKRRVN